MTATVYTDGSCLYDYEVGGQPPRGGRGHGGWAAICEHGSDGWVLRGSVPGTTNTAMELRAAIEGLRSLPPGVAATLYTDSTLLLHVHDLWQQGVVGPYRRRRGAVRGHLHGERLLWHELAGQYAVHPCTLVLVRRRDQVRGHQRAHAFAQHEARQARQQKLGEATRATGAPVIYAGQRRLRSGMVPGPGHTDHPVTREGAVAQRLQRKLGKARAARGQPVWQHLPGCKPGACVPRCPVYLRA